MKPIGRLALLAWAAAVGHGTGAQAQGFDCTKARSAVEQAICATPALMEQDRALSAAYAARLSRDPQGAAALRAEQRAWLAGRERSCASKAEPLPRVAACLAGLYRTRLVGLASAAVPPGASVPTGIAGLRPPAADGSGQLAPAAAQVLTAPAPPPVAPLPLRAPEPQATLARGTVPAAGRSDILVEVTAPGRFAIRAESRTGVALQLVDMIAGPGERVGEPGVKDGRVDALLDRGTYKLLVVGSPGAQGEARLAIEPFRQAADTAASLVFGGSASSDLSDLGQRSWWVQVEKPGRVSVEAAGRSLGDLRLWRNGRDLAALEPAVSRVTPKVGHPLTRLRLDGEVEPGLFLVTAYGGPKIAWTDGDPAEPLHVRIGNPEPVGSWVEGTVGPTGAVRFEAPAAATQFRLELPDPAPATLSVRRGADIRTVTIARNSREPAAALQSSGDAAKLAIVEVSGQEGQPFRLRALDPSASRSVAGIGPHWIGVDVAGEGGDEIPATVLLAQFEAGKGGRVLASNAPQVGPGRAWRQRLNLRGSSSLIFEVTGATPLAVTVTGGRVVPTVSPLLGGRPPRTDGKAPRWDLEPGWYSLKLEPQGGAFGIVDLTIAPPGVAGDAPKPQPARPSIPLGIQNLDRAGNYQILTNEAPGLALAPVVRALPANLQAVPFAVYQAAGQGLEFPVRLPKEGTLAVRAVNGVPVPVALVNETAQANGRTATVRLPPPERARGVVLSWLDPARFTPVAAPAPVAPGEALTAGAARFFDLARDAQTSFLLDVPEGGLYRVETLGRLKTSLTVATPFLPALSAAAANGAGQNALAQTYLRAGRYSVVVKAAESAGRLGVTARPAALGRGGTLRPDGSVRTTLGDGRGAVFPIEISQAGRYRLELLSLGDPFWARIEDKDGWPLTAPGPLASLEHLFEPGRYRLVVLPPAVEARVVARLSRIVPRPELAGHGPHPLAFDQEVAFQWREPTAAGETRVPDRWEFTLAGPADVTLALSDGMVGDLVRAGQTEPVGRIVGKAAFTGRLPPGRYTLGASAQGRNDRLDYRVSLAAREIQPGAARRIDLPAAVPFAIGEDRVVSLTSFGRTALRGVLKDPGGRVVERLDDRADDWNIGLSRRLPAGAYTLELSAVGPGPARKVTPSDEGGETASAEDGEAGDGESVTAESQSPEAEAASADPAEATEEAAPEDIRPEIRLALPEAVEQPALANAGETEFDGSGVSIAALPAVEKGSLLVVAGRAEAEIVLSLERRDAAGRWQVIGADRGRSPVVAAIGDGDSARPWRLSAWNVDAVSGKIAVAARSIHREPGGTGRLPMDAVELGSVADDVRIDLATAPSAAVLMLRERTTQLLEGSLPGSVLRPADEVLVPQADTVWLLARGPPGSVSVEPAPLPSAETALTVPSSGRATWPKDAPGSGKVRIWRALSTFGQPGLAGGRGMGVAPGSAVALGGYEALSAWNAGDTEPLPIRISAHDLTLAEEARTGTEFAGLLPTGTARPVRLPAGKKRLTLDLPAGTAAILDWTERDAVTVWTGDAAASRAVSGGWTNVLLVNLAPDAQPVRLALGPAGTDPETLAAGTILKRFFGAAGSLSMPVTAEPGDRIVTVGAEATFVGRDGRVMRGATLALSGPGDLVLTYKAGLVAAWIERAGRSPWPAAEARTAALPSAVTLEGRAMALALKPDGPVLLHARTSAPVILALSQGGQDGPPTAFAAGAELHRLLAPGEASLKLYSPHDGPLAGSLQLTASPVVEAREGIGDPVALAPGGTALFGFEVTGAGAIGIGIRAEPDIASARLLDEVGKPLGTGVAQLQKLAPGRYVLEASVPADGSTSIVRPAIVGLAPPGSGPPPDVVRQYLHMVGLVPTPPAR
ncbi:MAG: hypothetical protein JWR08_21 [Enterovirga sp.]|nr:hypothetical protein [Enterovirga sp.]